MSDCKKNVTRISLFADGFLNERERHALGAHVAVCPDCAARLDAFVLFRKVMPDMLETPPATLTPSILENCVPGDAALHGATPPPKQRRRRVYALVGTAAAAVLLLAFGSRLLWPQSYDSPQASEVRGELDVVWTGDPSDVFSADDTETYGDIPTTSEPAYNPEVAEVDVGPLPADPASDPNAPIPPQDPSFIGTVTLTAIRKPEFLAAFPSADFGDHLEVQVTVAQLVELWPDLHQAGALLNGADMDETANADSLPTDAEYYHLVLILVYITQETAP